MRRPTVESYNTYEETYERRPAFNVREHHPDLEPNRGPGSHAAAGSGVSPASTTPPRRASQAERAVMHPDRFDLEWRYYNGGWAG